MSTARLRKRFQYPGEGDSDDEMPHELDEEEQEKWITQLKEEDEGKNRIFKRILLALPLFSALTFMPALLTASSLQMRLISILAVSSLLCTGYVLLSIPNIHENRGNPPPTTWRPRAPLRTYIDYLNGGLSTLVGINAFYFKGKKGVDNGFWLLCMLPSVIFLVTILARQIILSVDIKGLEKLKYPYKGA